MIVLDIVDSTQLEAKRLIDVKEIIDNEIILANEQTAGITTKENIKWVSLKGNLLASYIFHLDNKKINTKNHIFFCLGLAIRDCIVNYKKDLEVFIKWPNDIIINKKKICGTICDIYKNHLIIGIGLNLIKYNFETKRFPATDLETETGILVQPENIAVKIQERAKHYINILNNYGFDTIKTLWKKYAYMIGEVVEKSDGSFVKFNDIDDNGEII